MKSAIAQHIQVCNNVLPRHVAFSIFVVSDSLR